MKYCAQLKFLHQFGARIPGCPKLLPDRIRQKKTVCRETTNKSNPQRYG